MKKYRVIGGRTQVFWALVDAESADMAYDIANDLNSKDWHEIETDNVIEAFEVEEEQ